MTRNRFGVLGPRDIPFSQSQVLAKPLRATKFARQLFAAALAAALLSTCFGQANSTIIVRVLNAKNRKPLKGTIVYLLDPNKLTRAGERYRGQNPAVASGVTDAHGVAVLNLSQPAPEGIVPHYGDILDVDQCMPIMTISIAEILKTGVVGPNKCARDHFRYTGVPKPGELVLFGKPGFCLEFTH